ncbi:response regulator [Sporosarcina thermotolerans]|uniref:Transcriptional regulatory protein n=1 Tax=Sporosarcina thermotolerans TaxID=633404 RepID=A0AAW9A6C8_9BACL|nr:response regulator [Sporosarcina thermotolerans]MDW0116529.1 response regulator [Sporosarcina thermotolerans]WHT48750.1 response regulator [Sporosarcina thermotolerans]
MLESIQVLIIEDDFRIAEINREFVNRVEGFIVEHVVKTGEEALTYLRSTRRLPQLILLDVYIPDVQGLNLFWTLRNEFTEIDVIMITAAKEVETIAEALRGGIFDYIVKPVDFDRFERTLLSFRNQKFIFTTKSELQQEEIDRLTGHQVTTTSKIEDVEEGLPKGIDQLTLEKVKKILQESDESGITALDAGSKVGVSRSTARRYLEYLVSVKEADAKLKYGDIGRPERKYTPWTK